MGKGMVRVDRGDGRLFQFQQGDVKRFLAANPGAHVVPGRGEVLAPTAAEEAATAALAGPELTSLTRAELEGKAAELGIDVSGAKNKGEIIALIEAAE